MTTYDFHHTVQTYFPEFDYKNPTPGTIVDARDPKNMMGHQQRAFTTYWALKTCSPTDLGLDLGSPRGMTPYCVHADVFGDGSVHPFYGGGRYLTDVVCDASKIGTDNRIFPTDCWPYIASNHSLEHMHVDGDIGIVTMLWRWVDLLRSGGTMALVVPDNAHFDVLASDKDHAFAWSHEDFVPRILEPLKALAPIEVVEYDTFDNHFSFNVLLKKK